LLELRCPQPRTPDRLKLPTRRRKFMRGDRARIDIDGRNNGPLHQTRID
jgi:hypothetical protein